VLKRRGQSPRFLASIEYNLNDDGQLSLCIGRLRARFEGSRNEIRRLRSIQIKANRVVGFTKKCSRVTACARAIVFFGDVNGQ